MDQIDLAPFTLRFLARVQLLRESTQLFRSAPHLPHDTSYLSCASSWVGTFRMLMSQAACRVMVWGDSRVSNAGSRLIGDGPSVPRGGIARCNKGGNPPYHQGLSKQGRVTLIRHDDDFKLFAPCQHLIQGGPGQHI